MQLSITKNSPGTFSATFADAVNAKLAMKEPPARQANPK
jgi:hypothetical protein